MMHSLTTFLKYVKADLAKYRKIDEITLSSSCLTKFGLLLSSYGLHAIVVYRYGKYIKNNRKLILIFPLWLFLLSFYYFLNFIIKKFYGIDIDVKSDIGMGFYIGHFGNIFIGYCKIGDNCTVNHQSRIRTLNVDYKKSAKILIGNNVWIGAQTRIEEEVVIGNNVTISGGSVVKSSVKDNALIMGNPARVIIADYDNKTLL
jgi:serine O-acetyltransferase